MSDDLILSRQDPGLVIDSLMHLDLALKSAGMGIFSYDIRRGRVFFDKQATKLLGITQITPDYSEEVLKNVHPDDREEIKTLLFLSIRRGKDFEAEYRIIWENGSIHYIVSRARIVRDENEIPVRLNGLIWEITEQKMLERNLHENLRKINSIINNLNGVVFRFRLDDNLTMEFISRGVKAITGYPSRDFLMNKTRSFHSLIIESDRRKLLKEIKCAVEKDSQYIVEYRIISSDGKRRLLSERGRGVLVEKEGIAVEGIITDITEEKNTESKLNRSLKQLKQLNQYLQTVRENERVAISRELHDDLGQSLTAVRIDLKSLKNVMDDKDEALKRIEKINLLVGNTIKSVQNITAQLRPQIIDDLGLEPAIEWYSGEFRDRTGINMQLRINPVPDIPSSKSLVVFRILQEALTNIARHSKATKAGIKLSISNGLIVLKVTDNGVGISEQCFRSKKSFGLISMRERALSLGGQLKISSPRKGGTEVILKLPLTDNNNHEDSDLRGS